MPRPADRPGVARPHGADVGLWAALFAAAALLRAGAAVASETRGFEAGVSARRRLRTAYLVAAFAAGPHRLAPAGEAVGTAVDQVDALDGLFARWLPASILAWAAPLLVLPAVLTVDPVAAAVMAAGGLLVPVGMAVAGLGAAAASQRQFEAMARLQTRFLDRVRGIATIVLAGQAGPRRRACARPPRISAGAPCGCCGSRSCPRRCWIAAAAGVWSCWRPGRADWRAGALHPIAAVFALVLVSRVLCPLRAFSAAYQDRMQATPPPRRSARCPTPPPPGRRRRSAPWRARA